MQRKKIPALNKAIIGYFTILLQRFMLQKSCKSPERQKTAFFNINAL